MKNIIDYGVIGLLVLMSIIAVAVAIERFRFFRRAASGSYPTIEIYEMELTKRLYIIATIGSNAPYVGLLGTVLGIIHTFLILGEGGVANVNAIMTGLALALKATAAGLLTAIPAIVLYNILLRRANELLLIREGGGERKEH
ncbi:MAG: TonB-system energizer ExbB [Deferribacteraceae bacterium]|jgi:biopolymer transport protein ExbB|nr:TonB-system energizer ExbB [Deferribacteraceae bacterium]